MERAGKEGNQLVLDKGEDEDSWDSHKNSLYLGFDGRSIQGEFDCHLPCSRQQTQRKDHRL